MTTDMVIDYIVEIPGWWLNKAKQLAEEGKGNMLHVTVHHPTDEAGAKYEQYRNLLHQLRRRDERRGGQSLRQRSRSWSEKVLHFHRAGACRPIIGNCASDALLPLHAAHGGC